MKKSLARAIALSLSISLTVPMGYIYAQEDDHFVIEDDTTVMKPDKKDSDDDQFVIEKKAESKKETKKKEDNDRFVVSKKEKNKKEKESDDTKEKEGEVNYKPLGKKDKNKDNGTTVGMNILDLTDYTTKKEDKEDKTEKTERTNSTEAAYYDPRLLGKVTPVKNQGDYGLCQTYARVAAIESMLIREGYETANIDLSEMQVAYTIWKITEPEVSFYEFCKEPNIIRNIDASEFLDMAVPVSESLIPMKTINPGYEPDVSKADQSPYVMTNVINVDTSSINKIKEAIRYYGGIEMSVCFDYGDNMRFGKRGEDAAYYQDTPAYATHAVEVIGWDDEYPADNFSKKPKGNGAWLCKNSWGNFGGSSGFVWVSYYDKTEKEGSAFSVEKKTEIKKISVPYTEKNIAIGQTIGPIVPIISPVSAKVSGFTYLTDKDGYISVSPKGEVTGLKEGTVTLTIVAVGSSAKTSIKFNVLKNKITCEKTIMVPDDGTKKLIEGVKTAPEDGKEDKIVYKVNDMSKDKAKLTDQTHLLGLSYGSGTLNASMGDEVAAIPFYVYCTAIDLDAPVTLKKGEYGKVRPKYNFKLSDSMQWIFDLALSYETSDRNILSINTYGSSATVHALGKGTAEITVKLKDDKLTNGKLVSKKVKITVE